MTPDELSKQNEAIAKPETGSVSPTASAMELTAKAAPTAVANEDGDITASLRLSSQTDADFSFHFDDQGGTIGRYKLIEKLGEGGFGSVWKAVQHHPIHREVAIKLLKSGLDSRDIVTRFAIEKQVLAVMDHPGIAKVYDAGMTESGIPYFVMELVRGPSLTQFCDSAKLNIAARIDLFLQVCHAIHHAHRKGIIHRDLKPSNILVVQTDTGYQVKVIDFGIAKATAAVSDITMQTQVGVFMGTPAYMSPEQADGLAEIIDIRTDIYSLGVILYELLTGVRPFEALSNGRIGVDEIRLRIRSEIPTRPSTRLRQVDASQLQEFADRTTMDSNRLVAVVRGDLDWITLKALEKDPARRYESAHELALDLQRHRDREPVLASPPSNWYVASRFVSKYRWAVTTVSIVMWTLVLASVASTVMYFNEQKARAKADQQSNRSQQMVKILSDMISAAGPSVSQGRDTGLMKDLLAETTRRIDEELNQEPEIELEIRRLLAKAYGDIGEYQLSYKLYQRVVALEELLHSEDTLRMANTYAELSESLDSIDRLDDAERLLRKAIELRESISPLPVKDIAADRELLGWLLSRQGDFAASEQQARQALKDYPPSDPDAKQFRGQALMTLGMSLLKTAQFSESETCHREALAIYREAYTKPHPNTVTALNNLCHLLVEMGKFDEVEELAKEALTLQELLDGRPIGSCTDSLNKALSAVHIHRGDFDRAIECLQLAILAATEIYGPDHRFTNDKRSLLAQVQVQAGRLEDAEKTLKEVTKLGGKRESADNSLAIAEGKLALAKNELDHARAIALQEYQRTKSESKSPSIGQIEAALLLIDVHLLRGEYSQAKELISESLQILRPDQNTSSILLDAVKQRQQASKAKENTLK